MGPRRWPLLWCLHAALLRGIVLTGGQRPPERPPRPAGWSPPPSPSWAATPEPGAPEDAEGSAAAVAFLQSGDAQSLARANCSRGVAAGAPGPGPPAALRVTLRAAPEALAHAANFLNMLFQTNDIREASVAEDVEWYQALVRSLAEGHPWVRRAVLALDAHPLAAKPRLMLQATKGDGEILLQDVSATAPGLGNLSWDNEWFNALKAQRVPQLRKRVLSNDLRSMETPKWQRGDSYVGDPGHVRWSQPFLECQDGRFLPAWAITLSSAFYGLKPDLSPEFKGVVRVDIELRDVAIDQCASGTGWFADTHRCDPNSTQCVPQESHSFVLGRYLCRCKPGFYGAGGVASGARAGAAGADGGSRLACRPCHQGCVTCEDGAPCLIQEDRALRAAVLSCQACCMLAVFLSMLVSYHFRRSKRIRASGVILLETILFGSLLLYFPVFILYFKPSIFRCIVLRWVRMLGFAIVYGTITLKLYRVLKVFLSRTAQRVPYVSSGRVLKMLGLILLLVLWFLAAWTIGMLENVDKNIPLVIRTQTSRGLHFYICGHDRWDYMMVIAEMLFLLWGSFLCYATRAVPSAFHEPRYMGIALHNELMISATFHVVRFIMVPSLHPDWTLLLFFAHTHGTITMTLALLFIPKFLHAGSPLREEIAAEVYEDELDTRRSGSCLNSSIASGWSEHSLDPDDIREELKKLYTQLEAHTTRRMAANNPHLPKKRSSRRSLARSTVRRGTEPPEPPGHRGGERAGTPARRRRFSVRRGPDASPRVRDGGSWHRTAALRKCRSAESPAGQPRAGLPALRPRGDPAPAAAEPSDSESLDTAPLVSRSASAQDLAGTVRPPLPHAPPLQKSLSVASGAREEALLAASRAGRGDRPPEHQGPPGEPPSPPAADAIPAGCPQEDTTPAGDGKVHKHVTYAPIKSVSIDGSHAPGRVRVAVRRTPPPPPVRYQSLGRRATAAGDSLEPPPESPAQEGKAEGPEEEKPRRGRLGTAVSIPAHVCPWELVQEEILSQKQKATEGGDSGTPGDAVATPPSLKPPSHKTSLRSLGLTIKVLNRARGRSAQKGKREGEGSLRRRGSEREGGSGREGPSLAETAAAALGGIGRDPTAKSPEWSRQRPGSEAPTQPWQGHTGPPQHNNAGSAGDAAGWGDSGAEGQSPAPGTGEGEKWAEELHAAQGHEGADGGPEIPPSIRHQEGAECPRESPEVAAEGPVVEPGKDGPAAIVSLVALKEEVAGLAEGLEGDSSSIHPPRDHAEVEQPHTKSMAGSSQPSAAGARRTAARELEAPVGPRGAGSVPAGRGAGSIPAARGALLRQAAIVSLEDSGVPPGEESLAKALGKSSSQPEPLRPGSTWGAKKVPPRSRSLEVAPAAAGRAGSTAGRAEPCGGENQAESSVKVGICPWEGKEGEGSSKGEPRKEPGTEKPPAQSPELQKAALEEADSMEGREGGRTRAGTCPWDVEGTQLEQERQEGQRRQWLAKRVKIISPHSVGLQRAQESGGSLQAPISPTPKPAPKSFELPEAASRSPTVTRALVCPWEAARADGDAAVCPWDRGTASSDAEKSGEGGNSHVKNGICPQGVGPRGTEETAAKGSSQQGSSSPREGTEQPSTGLVAKHPALPKTSPKEAATIESKKANTIPWELEDKQHPRTEICPWEGPAAPSGKETPSQDTHGASKGENKPGSTKLAELGGHWAEHGDTGTSAKPMRKSLEHSKAESKIPESVGSTEEKVCPRKSLGTEQPLEHPHTGSPALPKSPSKKSQSTESLKAEVCPWEAQEAEAAVKAVICPWEVAAPPSGKKKSRQDKDAVSMGSRSPSTSQGLHKGLGDRMSAEKKASRDHESISPWERRDTEETSKGHGMKSPELLKAAARRSESVVSTKAEVCPWESLGTDQSPEHSHTGSPALPKSPSKKSQSAESLKAEVCPWEAQEVEAAGKAEICPWEVTATPSHQRKAKPGPGSSSKGDKRILRQAAFTSPARSLGKGSTDRESICPWESLGTEQSPEHPRTGSPALPKSPSKKSQSTESLKAEVCPWEAQEAKFTSKAEICPWEVAAPPSGKEKPRQDKDAVSIGSRSPSRHQGLSKEVGDSTAVKKEKGSSDRESICPWESRDTEQSPEHPRTGSPALPKSPSGKSQSTESLKAEVCPWEAQEVKTIDKAEICPWEVAAPPSGKEKPRQDKDAVSIGSRSPSRHQGLSKETGDGTSVKKEKGSSDRESICPWESLDTDQSPEHPRTGSPALPKSPSKKSQSAESLKAEVCPWEAQDVKSMDKSEICPWEVAAPPSGKEKPRQDKDAVSIGSRSPSRHQGLSKEVGDSTAVKKEKGSSDRESICPWESRDTDQSPEHPRTGSPALPKSPSKKSQSTESLKAEVCPWEAQEVQVAGKAEICPWEVTATPSHQRKAKPGPGSSSKGDKRILRQAAFTSPTRSLGKGSTDRESICPWESLGTEQSPEHPRTGSPALPKSPSKKSQSTESLKAEVCPWEAQEVKSMDKAEICPWEVAAPLPEKGAAPGKLSLSPEKAVASEAQEKGSSEREVICPWESLGTREPSLKTAPGKEPSKQSDSTESRKSDVCPWEAAEPTGSEKESFKPDMDPQGAD